jgi:hypothetical protein
MDPARKQAARDMARRLFGPGLARVGAMAGVVGLVQGG